MLTSDIVVPDDVRSCIRQNYCDENDKTKAKKMGKMKKSSSEICGKGKKNCKPTKLYRSKFYKKPPKGLMRKEIYNYIDNALPKGKTVINKAANKIAQKTMWDVATNWFNRKIEGTIAGRAAGFLIPGADVVMTAWTVWDVSTGLCEIVDEDLKRMHAEKWSKCGVNFDVLIGTTERCMGYVCPEIYEECGSEENNVYCWNKYYDCMDECNDSEDVCYENCTYNLSECVSNSSLCITEATDCAEYCLLDKVLKYGENCKNETTECGMIENNFLTYCGHGVIGGCELPYAPLSTVCDLTTNASDVNCINCVFNDIYYDITSRPEFLPDLLPSSIDCYCYGNEPCNEINEGDEIVIESWIQNNGYVNVTENFNSLLYLLEHSHRESPKDFMEYDEIYASDNPIENGTSRIIGMS